MQPFPKPEKKKKNHIIWFVYMFCFLGRYRTEFEFWNMIIYLKNSFLHFYFYKVIYKKLKKNILCLKGRKFRFCFYFLYPNCVRVSWKETCFSKGRGCQTTPLVLMNLLKRLLDLMSIHSDAESGSSPRILLLVAI